MRAPTLTATILLAAALLPAAHPRAADLNTTIQPQTHTVQPPANDPHAYTPAPVPGVGPRGVAPENRAGNATDAGPINGTPLSGSQAPIIGTGKASRDQRTTDPTSDPILRPR